MDSLNKVGSDYPLWQVAWENQSESTCAWVIMYYAIKMYGGVET
jgi:hypothetical protein